MSKGYPEAVERLIDSLQRMPGIGRRSATRLAFHLLKADAQETEELARAITDIKREVRVCPICWHLAEEQPCRICADPSRSAACVLVVEQPQDLIGLESTGLHRGVYHVLTGRLDPLGGVGPEDLTIQSLLERIDRPDCNARGERIEEVIIGLSPTLEGDTTAHYLGELMEQRSVQVTRLARGLASGTEIEFAGTANLLNALDNRQAL